MQGAAKDRTDAPLYSTAVEPRVAGRLTTIQSVPELINKLPTTRYYGSKRKLLPWIYDCLKTLRFDTVLDAFGGTGSVTQLFRAMRKNVTYHDAFVFNSQVATATLANRLPLTSEDVRAFLSSCTPEYGIVSRQFEGLFFLSSENSWIDGFMAGLSRTNFDEEKRSLMLHLLYQACLKKRPFNLFHRANLGLRTRAGVKRSFGNATTWERPFEDHILSCFVELQRLEELGLPSAKIVSAGDVTDLPVGYDLVYLDPPYVSKRQSVNSDGYWRRYHFLEGLANYDQWEERIEPSSPIRLMKTPKHFSEWSSRSTSKIKLFDLISRHRNSTVVLSYLQGAHPDDEEIKAHFEACFPLVSVHLTTHSHALSNSNRRELLFIGRHR